MLLDGPVICLVTDRGRLCPESESFERCRRRLLELIDEAVGAEVDLVQVRERGLETAQLADLVRGVVDIARRGRTRVVVNDRLDVALACGADGVHLRGDSFPPAAVRRSLPDGFLIGRSVHNVDEARQHATAVDYLIAGTVFPTVAKPSDTGWLGAAGLAAIVGAVRTPVLAIGGVSPASIPDVAAAGAAGIAAIGLFLPGTGAMSGILSAVRQGFDSAWSAS